MPARKGWLLLPAALALIGAAQHPGWQWPQGRPAPVVPIENAMSPAKVELGRRLFYDADLSADGSMSCATCHVQRHAFADGNRSHPGVHGDPGRRNVPGLANLAWMAPLTWADPRIRTLEAQMLVPVAGNDPVEMGMEGREAEIAQRLERDPCYVAMFKAAFPHARGGIDMAQIGKALGAFERSMVSADSPVDRFRAGDTAALGPLAQDGVRAFGKDCAGCHAGPDLTDQRFHAIEQTVAERDTGLARVTGETADRGRFRTPGLRNVALTAPYLHDGSAATLAEALDRHIGIESRADRPALLAFLDALTDRTFVTDKRFSLPQTACGKPL